MSQTLSFPGLGWDLTLNRVAFTIPIGDGISIYWYGIIIALAFIAALAYAFRRMNEFGINADRAIDVVICAVIGGIIGARLYYVAFSWDYYQEHLDEIYKIWYGGLAIYGGLIGSVLVGILMCKLRKVKVLPMLDVAAGGFFIGQAIGRWGNFVNIEAFGSNTSLPWGMTSAGIQEYLTRMQEELAKIHVTVDPTQPVHPTFLYESLWCVLGFLFIAWYTKRRRFDGELTLFYIAWYGLGRAMIEGLRTDSLMLGNIRISQLLSIIGAVASVVAWIVVRMKIRDAHDSEYLKPFGKTEAAAEVVSGEYYTRLKEEKEAAKSGKSGDVAVAEASNTEESVPEEQAAESAGRVEASGEEEEAAAAENAGSAGEPVALEQEVPEAAEAPDAPEAEDIPEAPEEKEAADVVELAETAERAEPVETAEAAESREGQDVPEKEDEDEEKTKEE